MSTEEQTIALKEILGIPTNKAAPTTSSSIRRNNSRRATAGTTTPTGANRTATTVSTTNTPTTAASSLSTPKQKKSKTRTGSNSKEKRSSHKKSQQFIQSNSNGSVNANTCSSTEKRNTVQKTGKKNKRTSGGSSSKSQNEYKENQNYAWSAFQSPPDASNLPLPAFGSLSFDNDDEAQSKAVPTTATVATSATTTSTVTNIATTATTNSSSNDNDFQDTVKGNITVTSEHTTTDIVEGATIGIRGINLAALALSSNSTNNNTDGSKGGDCNGDAVATATAGDGYNTSNGFVSNNKDSMESSMKSPELHRIEMSTPKSTKGERDSTSENDHDDPLLMLMNPSYGNSRNSSMDRNLLTPPMQRTFPEPSIHAHDALHGGRMMTSPVNNPMMPPPFPMAPQPFLTIQVQVPSQLFPGRRMMVPVAPGCNIPVIVPEGVQGGMVIPVTIPNVYGTVGGGGGAMTAGASPIVPRGVQVPPMNLLQSQQFAYKHDVEHMHHDAAVHNQPARQNYNSPPTPAADINGGKGKNDSTMTASWADKVASTIPNSNVLPE